MSWLGALWGLLLFPCLIQAGDLELFPRKELPVGSPYVRLSSLVTDTSKAELYDDIFLGELPAQGQRSIGLDYIQKRLDLKGFRFTKATIRGGGDQVIIVPLSGPMPPAVPGVGSQSAGVLSQSADEAVPTPDKTGAYTYLALKSGLERGTLLAPEMFEFSQSKKFVEDAFTKPDDVIGYRLERSLSQGSVLNRRHVSIPPTIEKNAIVKIIIKAPGIEVSGIARSMEEGKVGDIITVRRQREILTGTIIDPHTVLIQ